MLRAGKRKKSGMKECNARQNNLLLELSSWCLQDLGTKVNRKKIETLVTIHVHQKDVTTEMFVLYKKKKMCFAPKGKVTNVAS